MEPIKVITLPYPEEFSSIVRFSKSGKYWFSLFFSVVLCVGSLGKNDLTRSDIWHGFAFLAEFPPDRANVVENIWNIVAFEALYRLLGYWESFKASGFLSRKWSKPFKWKFIVSFNGVLDVTSLIFGFGDSGYNKTW